MAQQEWNGVRHWQVARQLYLMKIVGAAGVPPGVRSVCVKLHDCDCGPGYCGL